MARTIEIIYNAIIAEKQAQSELNALQPAIDDAQTLLADLTSASKVAAWRLQAWTMAVAVHLHEIIFDQFKGEIETRAAEIPSLTAKWYADRALEFQFGDSLVYDGVKFVYSPIVEANQIIKRAVAIDAGGQVRIKVAKLNGTTLKPEALTAPELSAASDYLNDIKGAGINIAVSSADPDDIKVNFFIQYDPQVLAPDGSDLNDPAVFPVINAIEAYIENLPFNGVFNETALVDAVQAADGVLDAVLNETQTRFGAIPYAVIDKNYIPDAGHLLLDQGASVFTYTIETQF